jgi:hypothetical protein
MLVKCKNCNKEFDKIPSQIAKSKNNFCSKSCSATFNNKGKQRNPPKIRICRQCSLTYTYKRKENTLTFCSNCLNTLKIDRNKNISFVSEQIKQLTIGEYRNKESVKSKHPSWKHAHIRILNRSWNADLTKIPCQNCKYDKHIELCHIKSVASFKDNAVLLEVNSPDNNLVLCRNCHWELDNNIIKIEDIPKR